MLKKILNVLFYGNFFYGICAIVLCIETNYLYGIPLNGKHFYSIIFAATVFYYTFTYLKHSPKFKINERDIWYKLNYESLRQINNIILLFLIADIAFFIGKHESSFKKLSAINIGQILVFPAVAAAYTFNILPFPEMRKLRRIGWLKPFIIGFIWSGLTSIYPIIIYHVQYNITGNIINTTLGLLWLKNFIFITMLCVLFDIKDIEIDRLEGLKTFPVQLGITNTIAFVIIPLILSSVLVILKANALANNDSYTSLALNLFPYILLVYFSNTLQNHQKIMYYLFAIDGLMIVKAVCSILSLSF